MPYNEAGIEFDKLGQPNGTILTRSGELVRTDYPPELLKQMYRDGPIQYDKLGQPNGDVLTRAGDVVPENMIGVPRAERIHQYRDAEIQYDKLGQPDGEIKTRIEIVPRTRARTRYC